MWPWQFYSAQKRPIIRKYGSNFSDLSRFFINFEPKTERTFKKIFIDQFAFAVQTYF